MDEKKSGLGGGLAAFQAVDGDVRVGLYLNCERFKVVKHFERLTRIVL